MSPPLRTRSRPLSPLRLRSIRMRLVYVRLLSLGRMRRRVDRPPLVVVCSHFTLTMRFSSNVGASTSLLDKRARGRHLSWWHYSVSCHFTHCATLLRCIDFRGEMHKIPTGPKSLVSLPRQDGVAYHAQESWVLNETIRVSFHVNVPLTHSIDPFRTRKTSCLDHHMMRNDTTLVRRYPYTDDNPNAT